MAGFGTNFIKNTKNTFNSITKKLSTFGIDYESEMIKNSQAIGLRELQIQSTDNNFKTIFNDRLDDYEIFNIASKANFKKKQASSDKSYLQQRKKFKEFSNTEIIDDILEKLSNECIVNDDKNFFAQPADLNLDLKDEVLERYRYNFKYLYTLFGFNDGITAWSLFKKWLIDGYLAYEIIFNENSTKIIGFKELDPVSLKFGGYDKKLETRVWYQYKDKGGQFERKIPDSNIIYISYSSISVNSQVSYIQRLIKAYNVFDIMEQTRLIYSVTQSVFNKTFSIPTGGKSKGRAKQSIAKLISDYKENVFYDSDTGELEINGEKDLPFYKEYWFPKPSTGDSVDVSSINRNGPELSSIEPIKYFLEQLYNASKIPASRFDKQSPARYALGDPSDIEREEIQFGNFINRIQSVFQEILVKPLWIQMCLEFPGLASDSAFKSELGIKFNKNLLFEEFKKHEIMKKRVSFIEDLKRLEGDGPDREPYFNTQFLVEEYMDDMTEDMLKRNKKMKEEQREKNKQSEGEGGDDFGF